MSENKKFHTIIKRLEPYDNQTINSRRNSLGKRCEALISSRLREGVQEAVQLLKSEEGYVVAFPTETVYGLGANIFNNRAVKKIFEAKRRPQDNPLIVHISRLDMLSSITPFPIHLKPDEPADSLPSLVHRLVERFWPGPLTILFPASDSVSLLIRGSESIKTVAVRMPNHPIALALIDELGSPICAPSANLSGRPSPTTAQHVAEDLAGVIPFIIDGGPTHYGLESTVIDVSSRPPMILRPGALTLEELRDFLPDIQLYTPPSRLSDSVDSPPSSTELLQSGDDSFAPATPGLKYKHYSPNAQVILIFSPTSKSYLADSVTYFHNVIEQHLVQKSSPEKRIAILCSSSTKLQLDSQLQSLKSPTPTEYLCQVYDLGSSPSQIAQRLFATLRQVDRDGMEVAYVEGIPDHEVGMAVMNRLRKAASKTIILS